MIDPLPPAEAAQLRGLLRQGRFRECEELCRRLLASFPTSIGLYRYLGGCLLFTGRLAEAEAALKDAVDSGLNHPDLLDNLANVLNRREAFSEAERVAREGLDRDPRHAPLLNSLGNSLAGQKRMEEALACYERASAVRPDFLDAQCNQAGGLRSLRRFDEARTVISRVIKVSPHHPDALYQRGLIELESGSIDAAVDWLHQADRARPGWGKGTATLAEALLRGDRRDEARVVCDEGLKRTPGHPELRVQSGLLHLLAGDVDGAEADFEAALAARPALGGALAGIGLALRLRGRLVEAAERLYEATRVEPEAAETWNGLGVVLEELGQHSYALEAFTRALKLSPRLAAAENNLGNLLSIVGRHEEANAAYERAISFRPSLCAARTNRFFNENYVTGVTPARLFELGRDWSRHHEEGVPRRELEKARPEDAERPPRIGFVSADLRRHPVGYYLVSTLEALDRETYPVTIYHDHVGRDPVTERFVAITDRWRDTYGVSDEDLSRRIADDAIDILFDLSGHTNGNRLLVFARRPAPIQVSWIGHVGTTGLKTMDYVISDRWLVPPGSERWFTERVARSPVGSIAFDPPTEAPPVGPLPAIRAGHVTFGSFNNPAKLTAAVLDAWARILQAVPGSRLFLKYRGMDQPMVSQRIRDRLLAYGIDLDRLRIEGVSPLAEMYGRYQEVDIALDTFPFSGGLTTCLALQMGVPVITLPGETVASRQSMSYLARLDRIDLVACDVDDYVARAVALAADRPALAAMREELRPRLLSSNLTDGAARARSLERFLRAVWIHHCHGTEPSREDLDDM